MSTIKIYWQSFVSLLITATLLIVLFGSCNKNNEPLEEKNHASKYSSEVIDKWMTLQIRLMRNSTGVPNHAFSRHFAYAGIAAYESLVPAQPASKKVFIRWNGLSGLPEPGKAQEYYFPANVNAALASITRLFYPNASVTDKAAIDSLENALKANFKDANSSEILLRSVSYGKAVAQAVYDWSETDGYKLASNPYTAPTGPGLWKPTPPTNTAPVTPYWGSNRPIVAGSIVNTQPPALPAYSTDPSSDFYKMVKQVYDVSVSLNDEQKAMAAFWRDVPGVSSPGHWLSILQNVIQKTNSPLDQSALAYALTGTAINDALISCFLAKYYFSVVRPITFVRDVMGQSNWSSYLGTPAHPEYPSAHSSLSSAAADVLQKLYGNVGTITDRTYEYMGFAPRNYASFSAIGEEAGLSRLYAGIHYMPSINAGLVQGRKVTANIFSNSNIK